MFWRKQNGSTRHETSRWKHTRRWRNGSKLEDKVDATEENEVAVEHHKVEQLQVVIVDHPGRGSSKWSYRRTLKSLEQRKIVKKKGEHTRVKLSSETEETSEVRAYNTYERQKINQVESRLEGKVDATEEDEVAEIEQLQVVIVSVLSSWRKEETEAESKRKETAKIWRKNIKRLEGRVDVTEDNVAA